MYKFYSTKFYKHLGSVAYRQHKADSHCHFIHGYSLSFFFEFGTNELDVRNWVVDFGGLRPLKSLLETWFDHTLLVAVDDPMYDEFKRLHELKLAKIIEVEKTGCEGLSLFLYKYLNDPKTGFLKQLAGDRDIWCTKVEISETEANKAGIQGNRDNWHLFEND